MKAIEKCIEYNFIPVIINLITNCHQQLIEIISSEKPIVKSNLVLVIIKSVFGITRLFSNYSSKFRIKFQTQNGIKLLFSYLNDEILIDNYIKATAKPRGIRFIILHAIVRAIVRTLLNLSRSNDKFKQQWKNCEAVIIQINNFYQ